MASRRSACTRRLFPSRTSQAFSPGTERMPSWASPGARGASGRPAAPPRRPDASATRKTPGRRRSSTPAPSGGSNPGTARSSAPFSSAFSLTSGVSGAATLRRTGVPWRSSDQRRRRRSRPAARSPSGISRRGVREVAVPRVRQPSAVRASTERPRLSFERAATSSRSAFFSATVSGRSRTDSPSCTSPWNGRASGASSASAAARIVTTASVSAAPTGSTRSV